MSSSVADARRNDPSRVRLPAPCHYGIGIVGSGGTPQIAEAHGGSGGGGGNGMFPLGGALAPVLPLPPKLFPVGVRFLETLRGGFREKTIRSSSCSVQPSF